MHKDKSLFKYSVMSPYVFSVTHNLLPNLFTTPPKWNPQASETVPEALLQPLLPLPYITAENNSTPKQTGKCLMILYPSMSSRCQWNIVPWVHISFPAPHRATAGCWGRGPGTKFKHHFTLSNKGANRGERREESVTWKDCKRRMGRPLLAVGRLLALSKSWLNITTHQFLSKPSNGPSSLMALWNATTLLRLWDRMPNISVGDCFLLFKEPQSF